MKNHSGTEVSGNHREKISLFTEYIFRMCVFHLRAKITRVSPMYKWAKDIRKLIPIHLQHRISHGAKVVRYERLSPYIFLQYDRPPARFTYTALCCTLFGSISDRSVQSIALIIPVFFSLSNEQLMSFMIHWSLRPNPLYPRYPNTFPHYSSALLALCSIVEA